VLNGEPDWVPAQRLRLEGFTGVMREAGCLDLSLVRRPPADVVATNQSDWEERAAAREVLQPSDRPTTVFSYQSDWGEYAARELLQRPDRPTAIFAYNDRTALGVYRAARDLGLGIPEDLSVVGFDDQILVAAELRPELTTVALPHYSLGRLAAETLLEVVSAENAADVKQPSGTVLVPCPMVHRKSVGPPSRT
jgi:LacI family transcriptional regulator